MIVTRVPSATYPHPGRPAPEPPQRPPYRPEPPRRPTPSPPQPLPPAASAPVLNTPAAGIDPVLDRLLQERIIFLGREVDDEIANRISAQLLLLAAQDPDADITLYINSPGGSVTAGMAIYDTMQLVRPDVATWAVGFAASMGQFLLSAGAPGKRYALPRARIMMHQPSAGVGGTATDIAIRAGVYADMKREVAMLIARHTGQSFETITADSDRDRWFTAEQAREYGLVDQVVQV
jgi:ATP-dependent Clp protease protease subunit